MNELYLLFASFLFYFAYNSLFSFPFPLALPFHIEYSFIVGQKVSSFSYLFPMSFSFVYYLNMFSVFLSPFLDNIFLSFSIFCFLVGYFYINTGYVGWRPTRFDSFDSFAQRLFSNQFVKETISQLAWEDKNLSLKIFSSCYIVVDCCCNLPNTKRNWKQQQQNPIYILRGMYLSI